MSLECDGSSFYTKYDMMVVEDTDSKDYQDGYYNGYNEGYNKAIQDIKDKLNFMCCNVSNREPIIFKIAKKEDD